MILVYDIAYIIDYDDILYIIFCIYPNWADEQDATMSQGQHNVFLQHVPFDELFKCTLNRLQTIKP